jgi:hypothetical protein
MTAAMPIETLREVDLIHLLYMTLPFVVVLWETLRLSSSCKRRKMASGFKNGAVMDFFSSSGDKSKNK